MNHVVTLICDPERPQLDDRLCLAIAAEIGVGEVDWLQEGVACDIKIRAGLDAQKVERQVAGQIENLQIDVVVQPDANRRKKLLIADMDSTIIEQECIDELAAEVGMKEQVAAVTERAMNGEIDFEVALRQRVALLENLNSNVVAKVLKERITLTPGAMELVSTMRANGYYCVLVSGGFTAFASEIAARVGFDEFRANSLIVRGGEFAGRVVEPILGEQAKLDAMNEICATQELVLQDVIAVGDGANDLPMILSAGCGVAFRAKPVVSAKSKINITYGDLTALLYVQGYRESEFG